MIQSKELRRGNLVYHKWYNTQDGGKYEYDIIEVDAVLPTHVNDAEDTAYSCDELEPIDITDDLLLDFGYENWGVIKQNEHETYKRYVIGNFLGDANHEVHIITSTYGGTHEIEYVTSIDQNDRQYNGRMEFVHDLQNAVYKETGKELELKNR